jgi:hypothetical protein
MMSGAWILHGVRVRYYMRELCFFRSWDLYQLTRAEPSPPQLVSTWDAANAIRMNACRSECFGPRVIEELYRAVTRCDSLPSLSPRDLEERMLSTVLDAVKYGRLVAVEGVHSSPLQYVAAVEPPPEPPPGPVQEPLRDRYLRLRLVGDTEPRASKDYVLKLDDGTVRKGTTSSDGLLVEKLPPHVRRVRVQLESQDLGFEDYVVHVEQLGHPANTQGAQQRLRNAGFLATAGRGMDEPTRRALARFQERHGLKVTGEVDAPTKAKLEEVHGS